MDYKPNDNPRQKHPTNMTQPIADNEHDALREVVAKMERVFDLFTEAVLNRDWPAALLALYALVGAFTNIAEVPNGRPSN